VSQPVDPTRENRELIEILNELRIVLPGVQVLFAFLLTVPLTGRFGALSRFEKDLYLCAFFASAAAVIMLIAPTAYHRIQWRRENKEAFLETSNRLAVAGLAFLAIAMVAVTGLVTDLITSGGLAMMLTIAVAVVILVMWFAIPIWHREHDV
jgi:Family of unknown function (DUF6328)